MVKVVFVHPDLGIGGAERLVVDAALALQARGHSVKLFTAHHDPGHCFKETSDGTLDVTAVGDWLPRSFCGRCYALCAYIRMIYVALYLVLFSGQQYDVVFCDQISACIPFLKMRRKSKVLFYCHFPDQLLTQRLTFLKRLYRAPIDWLEERTTGMAHCVLVNSSFTAKTFAKTFPSLGHIQPDVLYPSLNFSAFDSPVEAPKDLLPPNVDILFLSINRFERKKNLGLAIEALGKLLEKLPHEDRKRVHLVMAGGYDERVTENREHYLELRQLADRLHLDDLVTFKRSFSDTEKLSLLSSCACLLYTPSNEHFGIVPIEAMYASRPVVAVNSGGPLETIVDKQTGFLCKPDPETFALAMKEFVTKKDLTKKFGKAGRARVVSNFSFKAFGNKLDRIVRKLRKL
ncbi:alpha-1,3/1,6-mannosyltransferase ALG2-like [Acanthaster planci]|uniref:Alpha-1,3/1,6-mannosyltransferase ALG2 n=1 Tax=Acanthaster planci TaxID=133434 RepID=A0A8B7Y3G8_ACAPL|nr:alpha-1,3/1,6-mannosyltransferase ALG2-like [Acanthaster planci]